MSAATAPHRLRALRWQARATQPVQALALRTLLHEQSDSVALCLEQALDEAAAALGLGPETVVHIGRLELALPPPPLAASPGAAAPDRAAWSQWLRHLRQAAALQVQQSVDAPQPADRATPQPAAAHARQALLDYLRCGWPGWALAGLDEASQVLREAAVALAEELVPHGTAALVEAAVPTLWRWTATSSDQPFVALGVLARWLALLTAPQRTAWVRARAAAPLAQVLFSTEPTPTVLALLAQWQAAAAAPQAIWAQALWLGWPEDASQQPQWRAALIDGALLDTDATPALMRLRVAVAADAARPPAPGRRDDAVAAIARGQTGAPPTASVAPPQPAVATVKDDIESDAEHWVVPLAGLVVLHPFLPRLLQGLQLHSGQPGEPLSPAVLPRALALLHALACGPGPTPALELDLPLLKLLLGLPPLQGLSMPAAVLAEPDLAEVQALLEAVRQHWPALRGSSVATLRLSFLQRRGLLRRASASVGAGWQLQMHGEAFDLLLAHLPWSLGWIKLPWMPEPLSVDWPVPT